MSIINKSTTGFLFLAGLLALGTWFLLPQQLKAAPDAVFKTISGETISLAALHGKPVLVTFWATDCGSCLQEIPDLIALHRQYSPEGLTIIAVAMSYDPPNRVLEMTNEKQLPYAVALDPIAEHALAFGNVQFTPTSFLLDRQGGVVMQKTGRFDLAEVREMLDATR
jgi:peroxiredoxin